MLYLKVKAGEVEGPPCLSPCQVPCCHPIDEVSVVQNDPDLVGHPFKEVVPHF